MACACSFSETAVLKGYPDSSIYRIGDASRSFDGRWDQPPFPSSPCPDPSVITWQYFDPFTSTWGSVDISTNTKPVRFVLGQTNNQLANSATWYYRDVEFFKVGTWRLRIRMACGDDFVSTEATQVVLAAPAAFIV